MSFANPWGLLALLAIPAIVVIHLFQQRFPPLLVGGAHLWGAETRVTTAGRRRDRLPVTASLLLELLASLLLAIGLSEPRFADTGEVTHLVAVLDDSASMLAHPAGAPSPRDLAVAELERRARVAGRNTVLTVIRSGRHPALVGSRAMTWEQAEAELAEWQPRAPRHEFAAAWDEAAQVAGERGRFLFLTDDMPQPVEHLPGPIEVIALGRRLNNVAIAAARWTFDSATAKGRVFFRVANPGAEAAVVQVRGASGGQLVFDQSLTVPAGGETPLEVEVPGGLRQITIRVSAADDALETDNAVTLIEPQVRLVTVAVSLPADSEERRLTERVIRAVPDVQPGPVEAAHLLIGPAGTPPESRREMWWLGIGPISRVEAVRKQAVTFSGPFIIDRQHPLLEGVTLGGVAWGGVQGTNLELVPLISCNRAPLLAQFTGTLATAYLMNIDLTQSNLGRNPDWPILLTNLVELRRNALPGLRRWNYRLDEEVPLRLERPAAESAGELLLVAPDGRTRPLIRDRNDLVEIAGIEQTGVYGIQEGSTLHGEFAVNFFDPEESSLRSISPGRHEPTVAFEATKLRLDNPYSWLILIAILLTLAAVLGDWYVLRGRTQVASSLP